MSKSYSEKVKNLLERFDNHSLKILLEEDEDSSETEVSKDSEDSNKTEEPSETEDSENEDENISFDFPKDSKTKDKDSEEENEEEEDIDDILGSEGKPPEELSDSGTSTDQLEDQLNNAVRDFQNQLSISTDSADVVLAVDNQANSFLDKKRASRGEDDLFRRLQVAGYQRKSIGNFIFEEKEEDKVKQKKFDDIEAQIEKLEYLTQLMDDKFNRKTNQIHEDDLPDILEKSIDLIDFHDPVEYAHDETIKYISVKADPKLKERLIEDFKVMFNERCKKEGYDTSSITGMTTASPTKFKTGVTGVQS